MTVSPPVSSRALLVLAGAGFAFGALYVGLVLGSDHVDVRGLTAALGLLVGWSFIGTGLLRGGGARATARAS